MDPGDTPRREDDTTEPGTGGTVPRMTADTPEDPPPPATGRMVETPLGPLFEGATGGPFVPLGEALPTDAPGFEAFPMPNLGIDAAAIGAVTETGGIVVIDMSVIADEIERRAHARGELAPWEQADGPADPTGSAVAVDLPTGGTSYGPFPVERPVDDLSEIALRDYRVPALSDVVEPDARCVAATGISADRHNPKRCPVHGDGAHRCHRAPEHQATERTDGQNLTPGRSYADHVCDCGFIWTSLDGGVDGHAASMRRASESGAERFASKVLRRLVETGYDLNDAAWSKTGGPDASRSPYSAAEIVRQVAREAGVDL